MPNINRDPFFVIDDSGSYQNLHVVTRSFNGEERIVPFSLVELTASTVTISNFEYLTSSIDNINSNLSIVIANQESGAVGLQQIYDQLTASYDQLTASHDQLVTSNEYLLDISSSINSSNILLDSISGSVSSIHYVVESSLDQLTASNENLISISSSIDLTNNLLEDISSSNSQIYNTANNSYSQLTNINNSIGVLTGSSNTTYNYLTSSINTISTNLSQSTAYVKQLASYNRATTVRSTILDLVTVAAKKDLAAVEDLIPGGTVNAEEYLRACVDVLIQNSTNKNCYVKVSHLPEATVAENDYTIKLPPGVIYNSDSQIANMRHVVYVPNTADVGEVSAMLTYNTTLLTDTAYPPLVGQNTIYSLAVNFYDFYDTAEVAVVNEWHYANQEIFNKFTITGQARVSSGGQKFNVYIRPSGSLTATGSVEINQTTPQDFNIVVYAPLDGNYQFIVDATEGGLNNRGDGRILFADVLIQSSSV